jgi:uncharacterized protein (DUF433 family)
LPVYNDGNTEGFGMKTLTRITFDPQVMGGKACIRGMRVTVGTVLGLMASGHTDVEILAAYPYLEEQDLRESLAYGAWLAGSAESPFVAS